MNIQKAKDKSMSFSVGIIGLPNAGKSTLFKALTKKRVDIAAYPFTTIEPNIGKVIVPDERLKKIAQIVKPEKTTETIIEFVDIAGLVKGAHKGEGLGNQFLSHIRNCNAVIEVVRVFENPDVEHIERSVNPERDIEIVKTELLMKDLETLENIFQKLEKEVKSRDKKSIKKFEFFKKIKELVSRGKLISEINLTDEEKIEIKEYQLLTTKPKIYIFNIKKEEKVPEISNSLAIDLKLEEEASELSETEAKELKIQFKLDQLILACYNVLDLITFFTVVGGKEVRAWTLKKGSNALEAAGKVHSDFKEKFIKAEVINWQKLVEANSWTEARELGWLKTVGKGYIVQDGDVIEFKI